MGKKKLKAFVIESGKTLNSGQKFVEHLSHRSKVVQTVDKCDVVLGICPIVSRVGTDIEAAMTCFEDTCKCSTTKPIILLVLHHTFDRDYVVPDCSRYVGDRVALIVNGLFHEDHGLLENCDVNTKAIKQTLEKLKEFQEAKKKDKNETDDSEDDCRQEKKNDRPQDRDSQDTQTLESRSSEKKKKKKTTKLKAFVIESGKTLNAGQQFVQGLSEHVEEVKTVDECDVVLAICPIVSRVGTDVEAAMKGFEDKYSSTKPIILVVLHHTFDKDYVVPDGSRYVGDRVSLTVNGLFHEDHGLLKNCDVNTQAIKHTLEKLEGFQKQKMQMIEDHRQDGPPKKKSKMLKDDHGQDEPPKKIEEDEKKGRTSSAAWNAADVQKPNKSIAKRSPKQRTLSHKSKEAHRLVKCKQGAKNRAMRNNNH